MNGSQTSNSSCEHPMTSQQCSCTLIPNPSVSLCLGAKLQRQRIFVVTTRGPSGAGLHPFVGMTKLLACTFKSHLVHRLAPWAGSFTFSRACSSSFSLILSWWYAPAKELASACSSGRLGVLLKQHLRKEDGPDGSILKIGNFAHVKIICRWLDRHTYTECQSDAIGLDKRCGSSRAGNFFTFF